MNTLITHLEVIRQFFDENRPLPHIDITSPIIRMFLNIPVLVVKTSFTTKVSSTKKGTKTMECRSFLHDGK